VIFPRIAEIVMRLDATGIDRQCPLVGGDGFLPAALSEQSVSQVVVCDSGVGMEGQPASEGVDSGSEVTRAR